MSTDTVVENALSAMTTQALLWLRQAGQIALPYFKQGPTAQYKEDRTFLTQADLEIDRFLTDQIRTAYPHHHILTEETTPTRLPTADDDYTWVIDPIDGTTAFVQGLPGWGIALGLMRAGAPVLGLFYMPLLDDMTYTPRSGLYANGHCLEQAVRPDWSGRGFLAVSAGAHRDFEIALHRTRALGSVSASLIYTARGTATAALIPRAYLWDLAAGAPILARAGGELRYLSGAPVELAPLLDGRLAPEPILAGHPAVVAEVQGAIHAKNGSVVSCH